MKRSDPERIDEIIRKAIDQGEMTDNFDLQRASAMWPEVVGNEINAMTTRRYVEDTTLHVYISSAALKNELEFRKEQLLAHLNAAVGLNALTKLIIH